MSETVSVYVCFQHLLFFPNTLILLCAETKYNILSKSIGFRARILILSLLAM